MSEDDIIKIDTEIIETFSGARYERRGSTLYSLNYAEPGMWGDAMGKIIPPELANKILEKYRKEQQVSSSLNFRRYKTKEANVKLSEIEPPPNKVSKAKVEPKPEPVVRKLRTGTGVKLFRKAD